MIGTKRYFCSAISSKYKILHKQHFIVDGSGYRLLSWRWTVRCVWPLSTWRLSRDVFLFAFYPTVDVVVPYIVSTAFWTLNAIQQLHWSIVLSAVHAHCGLRISPWQDVHVHAIQHLHPQHWSLDGALQSVNGRVSTTKSARSDSSCRLKMQNTPS